MHGRHLSLFLGARFAEFRRLCVTAGNPLNHFDVPWNGAHVKLSENVNTLQAVQSAVNGKLQCLTCLSCRVSAVETKHAFEQIH